MKIVLDIDESLVYVIRDFRKALNKMFGDDPPNLSFEQYLMDTLILGIDQAMSFAKETVEDGGKYYRPDINIMLENKAREWLEKDWVG